MIPGRVDGCSFRTICVIRGALRLRYNNTFDDYLIALKP